MPRSGMPPVGFQFFKCPRVTPGKGRLFKRSLPCGGVLAAIGPMQINIEGIRMVVRDELLKRKTQLPHIVYALKSLRFGLGLRKRWQ